VDGIGGTSSTHGRGEFNIEAANLKVGEHFVKHGMYGKIKKK
jgi:hypothetical protein